MIADKVLGNIHEAAPTGTVVAVPFAWFETEKKRIAKTAADGTEIGVCVGDCLRDGDILGLSGGKVYAVAVAPSRLIRVRVSTMQQMGRLCFELGNRHLSLKIEEHAVSIAYDEPTFLYLQKLGFDVSEVHEAFSGFIACKAHSHEHSHGHAHG